MIMTSTRSLSLALTSATLLLACSGDDQLGTPQPLPIPSPRQIRLSAARPDVEREVTLVGLPAAVAGAGQVTVRNGDHQVETTAAAGGSFFATIRAKAFDRLQVRYRGSAPVELEVEEDAPGSGRLMEIPGVPPVSAAGPGRVRVQAELGGGGNIGILVVNTNNGAVAPGVTDAQSRFAIDIAAETGDVVMVYVDSSPLGSSLRLVVP